MSFKLTISKGDLAKSIPLPGGWQKFEILSFTPKPSKDGGSVNYNYELKLEGDEMNRIVIHNFNSKAMGFFAPFIAALTNKTIGEILASIKTDSLEFDAEAPIGKKIHGKVEIELYQGDPKTKIKDWAPYDKVPF